MNLMNPKTRRSEMQRDCYTCRFWKGSSHGEGECRRHPPQLTVVPDGNEECPGVKTAWPETDQEDWCGEWEFRDVPHGKLEWETGGESEEIVQDAE
jgi:hypothetical protein